MQTKYMPQSLWDKYLEISKVKNDVWEQEISTYVEPAHECIKILLEILKVREGLQCSLCNVILGIS